MPLPSSKRLVRASLLAAATAILLGAAAGASNGVAAQNTPTITIPSPHLGDRGAYAARLGETYETPSGARGDFGFLDFEWQTGEPSRMGDGRVHATDRLRSTGWDYRGWIFDLNPWQDIDYGWNFPDAPTWTQHHQTLLLEQGGSRVLAVDDDLGAVTYSNTTVLRNGIRVGPATLDTTLQRQTTFLNGTKRSFEPDSNVECLFVNGFQNRTLSLGDEVGFERTCLLHGLLYLDGGRYRAAASEWVQGLPALRMEPIDSAKPTAFAGWSGFPFTTRGATMWLADGIPYPVRLASGYTPGFPASAGHSSISLDLVGFARGMQPRTAQTAPLDPAPQLIMAPTQPWGPDETGIRHPFPLSAAYVGARDQWDFPDLRNYLQSHPDAFTSTARYELAASRETGTQRTWIFTVTDGKSGLEITATRTQRAVEPAPGSATGPWVSNTTYSSSEQQPGSSSHLEAFNPRRLQAPLELPTVASMMARWAAYAAPGYQVNDGNAWGFQTACLQESEAVCGSPWAQTWAGHLDANATPTRIDSATTPPTLSATHEGRVSLLSFDGQRTASLTETSFFDHQRTGFTTSSPPAPGPAAQAQSTPSLTVWMPRPEQAAGAGVVALVVALLYYLWPLLKGGGVGLFSRLKEPQILGHPARRQLLRLIEAEPGIHFKEMARRTGFANGSLVHHLETLRRTGQVAARPSGGYTLYFLGSHVPAGAAASVASLKAPGARRILEIVRQQPGLSNAGVALICGLRPSTVSYHIQRLQEAGLVTILRHGRQRRFHAVDTAA